VSVEHLMRGETRRTRDFCNGLVARHLTIEKANS
jgi:hypothetical protein